MQYWSKFACAELPLRAKKSVFRNYTYFLGHKTVINIAFA